MTLTYRTSTSGSLQAAYSGDVRIGYVERRADNRWVWQLSLIVQGIVSIGSSMGRSEDEETAKEMLHLCFLRWVEAAGLKT